MIFKIEYGKLALIFIISGSFNVLGDKLNENLKRVFEGAPDATEPKIYEGTFHRYDYQLR